MIRFHKMKIYDKGLGKVKIKNRYSASDDILAVAISKDGHSFVASTFDKVYYFSDDRFQWKLHIDNFNSLSLSSCGKFLVIGTLSRLIYVDAQHFKPEDAYIEKTKELPKEQKANSYWITPVKDIDIVVISSDGKNMVIGREKMLYYYSHTMEKLWSFEMGDKIWGISISQDGNVITAGSGKEVYYFNSEGKLLWQFRTGSLVRFPHLSSDGKRVITSSNKKLYMFSQRGQLLFEVDTGTTQTLGASNEIETIAGASSTEVFCFNAEGKRQWEKQEKDFINAIQVTANGEGIVVGTGSDILNNPVLQVYYKDGTLLWSHFPRSHIRALAVDENGHNIIAGVGKYIKRFQNTIILTRTAITVSERCEDVLKVLKGKGIDVQRHEEEFSNYYNELNKGKIEDILNNLLNLERRLIRIKERYHMAKETIPNWFDTLGINIEVNDALINGIFPLYNKYIDINDNSNILSKRKQLDSYIKNLKRALGSVDTNVLDQNKSSMKRPILRQKLSVISTTLHGITGLRKVVKDLQNEKINLIFELEDTTRNIIIDHLSRKNYQKEITEAIQKAENFEEKIETLLFRIQNFESTIKMWREQEDMLSPDSVLVDIKTSTREENGQLNLIINLTNNYESPISKVAIRTFTSDPIYNFIDPDHGVISTQLNIPTERTEQFQSRFRSDSSTNVVVNGFLIYELEKIEYQVKLPSINISLLSPTITGLTISEKEYSKIMDTKETYHDMLTLKEADMKLVMDYIQKKLKRFNIVRDKKATTKEGEARILWNAGHFITKEIILVTMVVRERENQEIEIGSSGYSTDTEKASAFVQDLMNYFRMNFKIVESGT